jgi:XTP/dITP diphosphohydrolase
MTTHELGGWVLASSNRGKLAEFRTLLAGTGIRLEAFADDGPEESGLSFVENALIKARHAAELSGRPALADDSGLCVAALDGEPGVRSARYAGDGASDAANVDRLLARLAGVEPHRRQAAFVCVIVALKRPDDPDPVVAAGRWPGLIAPAPLGSTASATTRSSSTPRSAARPPSSPRARRTPSAIAAVPAPSSGECSAAPSGLLRSRRVYAHPRCVD